MVDLNVTNRVNRYPTLDELAASSAEINADEFGAKSVGLVTLVRNRELVPRGFVVGASQRVDEATLRNSFGDLTHGETDLCGYKVRGTTVDEKPSQLPTLDVIYDPGEPDTNLRRLIDAIELVRDSHTLPVIVQRCVGSVSTVDGRRLIGYTNSSFVTRSHSHVDPSRGVVTMCFGLPSYLVNNPEGMTIVMFDGDRIYQPINRGNSAGSHNYVQTFMDVLDVEGGNIVKVLKPGAWKGHNYKGTAVPFEMFKHIEKLVESTRNWTAKLGMPVELEGTLDWTAPREIYIVQLTKSHLLRQVIDELTCVDRGRIVLSYNHGDVVGSMKFNGDVAVLANGVVPDYILERVIKGEILVIGEEFPPEGSLANRAYVRINNPGNGHTVGGWTARHALSLQTTEVYRRTSIRGAEGNQVCSILAAHPYGALRDKDLGDFCQRRSVDNGQGVILLKNASVEATRGQFQMYFN